MTTHAREYDKYDNLARVEPFVATISLCAVTLKSLWWEQLVDLQPRLKNVVVGSVDPYVRSLFNGDQPIAVREPGYEATCASDARSVEGVRYAFYSYVEWTIPIADMARLTDDSWLELGLSIVPE
jgi:hypothetical protein